MTVLTVTVKKIDITIMTDSFEKYISTWMMTDLKNILCSTTITAASSFEKGILHYCNDSDSLGKVICISTKAHCTV